MKILDPQPGPPEPETEPPPKPEIGFHVKEDALPYRVGRKSRLPRETKREAA